MSTNLLMVALFVFCMLIMSLNLASRKKRVIFFGANINELDTLSGGYIGWITEMMKEEGVEEDYQLTHALKPSDTIKDLVARMNDNLLLKDPKIAVIYLGSNDFINQLGETNALLQSNLEETLQLMLNKIKSTRTKAIVCTTLITLDNQHLLAEIGTLNDTIRHVAHETDSTLVDLSEALSSASNQNINQLVAIEIWKAIKTIK